MHLAHLRAIFISQKFGENAVFVSSTYTTYTEVYKYQYFTILCPIRVMVRPEQKETKASVSVPHPV